MQKINAVTTDDLDNTTIVLNEQGKVSSKVTPQQSTQIILDNLEIVENVVSFHDGWGNQIDTPFSINIDGTRYAIDKVGRIKGTNWLVFGSTAMG